MVFSEVKVNDRVILKKETNSKICRVVLGRKMSLSKEKFLLDNLVGQVYGSSFRVEKGSLIKMSLHDINSLSLNDDSKEGEDKELLSNRELLDDRENQKMGRDEIADLKEQGMSGELIVEQLVKNSSTFGNKTEFSKQKYIKRKTKKHLTTFSLLACNTRNLLEMYFNKGPTKICNLRMDSLAQVLNGANVRVGGRYMVVDGCSGLLTGALLERLNGNGLVVSMYSGSAPARPAVELGYNFSESQLSVLKDFPLTHLNILSPIIATLPPKQQQQLQQKQQLQQQKQFDSNNEQPLNQQQLKKIEKNQVVQQDQQTSPQLQLQQTSPQLQLQQTSPQLQKQTSQQLQQQTSPQLQQQTSPQLQQQTDPQQQQQTDPQQQQQQTDPQQLQQTHPQLQQQQTDPQQLQQTHPPQLQQQQTDPQQQQPSSEQLHTVSSSEWSVMIEEIKHDEDDEHEVKITNCNHHEKGTSKRKFVPSSKRGNRKPETLEQRNERRVKKRNERSEMKEVIEESRMDGLLICTRSCMTNLTTTLLPLLKPGRPIVVFSQYREPLIECYTALKNGKQALMMKMSETWLRQYQILENRSHPLVNMSGSGGFILTAIKVQE